jgi:hypothetical protein
MKATSPARVNRIPCCASRSSSCHARTSLRRGGRKYLPMSTIGRLHSGQGCRGTGVTAPLPPATSSPRRGFLNCLRHSKQTQCCIGRDIPDLPQSSRTPIFARARLAGARAIPVGRVRRLSAASSLRASAGRTQPASGCGSPRAIFRCRYSGSIDDSHPSYSPPAEAASRSNHCPQRSRTS